MIKVIIVICFFLTALLVAISARMDKRARNAEELMEANFMACLALVPTLVLVALVAWKCLPYFWAML